MKPVFDSNDYRKYLTERLGSSGTRTGQRLKACRHLGCHSTYLSQVLSEKMHLSLEYAEALNEFLSHTAEEAEYFMLLVLKGRAGSKKLKDRFEHQLKEISTRRNFIKNRVNKSEEISAEYQDRFYSHWIYGALHVLISIEEFQTAEAIAKATGMHLQKVHQDLEFLLKTGLIVQTKGRYTIGPKMIHLGSDSHLIAKHHTNWRFHAIQNVGQKKPDDLHYSAIVSLSEEDAAEIRAGLLKNLEKNMKIIKDSHEESAYVFNFDFYQFAQGKRSIPK